MSASKVWDAVQLLQVMGDDALPCTRCGCTRRVLSSTKGGLCPGCGALRGGGLPQEEASHAATLKELDALRRRLHVIVRRMRDLANRHVGADPEPPGALVYHLSMFAEGIEAELPPDSEPKTEQRAAYEAVNLSPHAAEMNRLIAAEEKLEAQVASLQAQRDDNRQQMRALAKQLEAAEQRAAAAEGGRESLLQVIRIMGQSG